MANTTNFGWETPDDTDLVKDGAAAIRTLGSAIDTSLVDLKGGTTNQVLAKNSNTDMDFKWVETDDTNAIQNAIVDAKGDLIAASAADTPARLAVGNNGDTLLADSATTTGLRWQSNFDAGKNKLINSDFRINQRNFTSNTANQTYNFDRWVQQNSGGTVTVTPQTFTAGTAPVTGYEGINFVRIATTGQTAQNQYALLEQRIEDVRTFANQTITLSFWAKASSGTPYVWLEANQVFGSGGSATVGTQIGATQTISTSWARYSVTVALPSISGKTIGTGSYLSILLWTSAGSSIRGYANATFQNATIDFWGVQLEAGSVATAFQTATGTLQGELAACQRYFWKIDSNNSNSNYSTFALGDAGTTTRFFYTVFFPVPMRVRPTQASSAANTFAVYTRDAVVQITSINGNDINLTYYGYFIDAPAASFTQGSAGRVIANNNKTSYIEFSAEL